MSNEEMGHEEFIRANFFSPAEDGAAPTVEQTVNEPKPKKTRKRRVHHGDIEAMAAFARAMETAPHNERLAAIGWLADKCLGMRLRLP